MKTFYVKKRKTPEKKFNKQKCSEVKGLNVQELSS